MPKLTCASLPVALQRLPRACPPRFGKTDLKQQPRGGQGRFVLRRRSRRGRQGSWKLLHAISGHLFLVREVVAKFANRVTRALFSLLCWRLKERPVLPSLVWEAGLFASSKLWPAAAKHGNPGVPHTALRWPYFLPRPAQSSFEEAECTKTLSYTKRKNGKTRKQTRWD